MAFANMYSERNSLRPSLGVHYDSGYASLLVMPLAPILWIMWDITMHHATPLRGGEGDVGIAVMTSEVAEFRKRPSRTNQVCSWCLVPLPV